MKEARVFRPSCAEKAKSATESYDGRHVITAASCAVGIIVVLATRLIMGDQLFGVGKFIVTMVVLSAVVFPAHFLFVVPPIKKYRSMVADGDIMLLNPLMAGFYGTAQTARQDLLQAYDTQVYKALEQLAKLPQDADGAQEVANLLGHLPKLAHGPTSG